MHEEVLDGPSIRVAVPAKANLFLAVRGRRSDGYHELVTVFQTVSLYDHLRVGVYGRPGTGHHPAARRRMRIELVTDRSDLGPVEANLALMAARALADRTGVLRPTAAVQDAPQRLPRGPRTILELTKGIPVAGGMAGGSADAAAALVALNELWGCQLDRDALRELAADLGSDVPFCVVGGTAIATGRGTTMAQVLCRGTFHWVVCTAHEPLSTAAVFRAWDRLCGPTEVEPDAVLAALRGQDALALGGALHNELEPAAFALRPELSEDREALLDAGALGAVLSGSGPTMLGLAESCDHARQIADEVGDRFATTAVAQSPVGGPELRRS